MVFPFVGILFKTSVTLLSSILFDQGFLQNAFLAPGASCFFSAFCSSDLGKIDLSHLTEISDERLIEICNDFVTIKLNGLKTFSARQARVLMELTREIHLDGLTEIDEPLADELSRCHYSFISLNGIKKIRPELLKKVCDNNKVISLASISLDEIRNLRRFFLDSDTSAFLILNGVEHLPLDVANLLANFNGGIYLNQLKRIEDKVLVALGRSEATFYSFGSLEAITDDQAEVLSTFKQPLWLNGLKKVTDRQFFSFCRSKNLISLAGLEELSDRQLQMLGAANHPIKLRNLKSLPREVIRHCSKGGARDRVLDFPCVQALDDEQVRELADFEGVIKLNGVKRISRKQAGYLGTTRGELQLNGLTSLSSGCAKQLFNQKGCIFLNGLSRVEEESSVYLKNHLGPILLDGVTSITDKNAQHFSEHRGTLSLAKLSSVTDLQMDLLAKKKPLIHAGFDGDKIKEIFSLADFPNGDGSLGEDRLILNGLKSLSSEQSESLSKGSYDLELNGITRLNAKQARDFLELNHHLSLNGIRDIEEDALAILFQRCPSTSLCGIKKINLNHARILADRSAGVFQTLILTGVKKLPIDCCNVLGSKTTAELNLGLREIDKGCRKALKKNPGIHFLSLAD